MGSLVGLAEVDCLCVELSICSYLNYSRFLKPKDLENASFVSNFLKSSLCNILNQDEGCQFMGYHSAENGADEEKDHIQCGI